MATVVVMVSDECEEGVSSRPSVRHSGSVPGVCACVCVCGAVGAETRTATHSHAATRLVRGCVVARCCAAAGGCV